METIKEKLDRRSIMNEETGCIEWQGALRGGYGTMHIKLGVGKYKTIDAHRAAYQEYVGETPKGICVCHRCDNRCCINPEHLFLGTHQDNVDDRDRKGRGNPARGRLHGRVKLTETNVIRIRELRKHGWRYIDLAKEFGVHTTTIKAVVLRETWR